MNPATGKHFGSSVGPIPFFGDHTAYIAVTAFVCNLLIGVLGTLLLRALKVPEGRDSTRRADYHVEAGDPIDRRSPMVEPTV